MPTSDRITILCTADVHGRVGPDDPFGRKATRGGLARAASVILDVKQRDPEGTFYIDLGDLVQGSPMSYLHVRELAPSPHPLVRVLNELDCRGMVVGNHEFNFGLDWIEALERDARFPILAANVFRSDGRARFAPVLWLERGSRRVAILAITTPQVPRWEEPWNIEGLEFSGAIETVRKWLPELRQRADAIVLAAHMGWKGVTDGGLENPEPHENEIAELVNDVPGLDAILMAHTHRVVPARRENGTLVMQPGSGGEAVGEISLSWTSGGELRVEGDVWEIGEGVPICGIVRELAEPAERRAAQRTSEILGTAEAAFRIEGLRYRDNAMLTLLHKVELEESGADLSSAALFRAEEGLEAGPVRVLDLFRIYPFENSLMVLELTVDDIRDYLEQIAIAYLGPTRGGEPPPLHPDISLYNHDTIAGCEYVIDPARPHGQRITHLSFHGQEWPGDRKVTLALTSYRAQGGGGYRALRRGRVVSARRREVRWIIGEYISRHERIRPEVFDNWRVEGVELGDARVSGALS